MRAVSELLLGSAILTFATASHAQDVDWQKIDETFARKPAISADVHRYGFPRTDLTVVLDGVTIKRALAFGGWIAFKQGMVMGDLVLLDNEVAPVMTKLIENGMEITTVHNHLLRTSAAIFYMHVGGHSDPLKMAAAIRTALAESKTPLSAPARAAAPPPIDSELDKVIGVGGRANGGVYQFAVPRHDPVTEGGMVLAPAGPVGAATAIGFQPTGGGKAAITGDFVTTADEVNSVIKALRDNGIEVTALHSHMLTDEPRLFFMHFWRTTMRSSSPEVYVRPRTKWNGSN